jgi:dTDP-glucose 4,6-dehydratase/UDP-glucose 4-epimerase
MSGIKGRRYFVTGGSGFIGGALVRRLVAGGANVRVLDNLLRGSPRQLESVVDKIELVRGDVRDLATVVQASAGCDSFLHLAYLNGTEFFYSQPELVLEIAVKGTMNALDAVIKNGIKDFVYASSSEVYQTPPQIPTPETVPLVVPDVMNARYSYGGGKIIGELLCVNYGRKFFDRMAIFRPHNVYGPDMGGEHVLPQFILRAKAAVETTPSGEVPFAIQGQGNETRSFIYIDDFTDGLMLVLEKGRHNEIYHIGTQDEISVRELATQVVALFGRQPRLEHLPLQAGSTARRCPDIGKLRALGFTPKTPFAAGLKNTFDWYVKNARYFTGPRKL